MSGSRDRPARPAPPTLVMVGAWGAGTALLAALLSGGSPLRLLVALFMIGAAQRGIAIVLLRRRGTRPPRWWWL